MKLRIRGNSLRLRLTRGEVDRLAGTSAAVEESITFAPDASLTYAIRRRPVAVAQVTFNGKCVELTVPDETVLSWARSDEVGFEAQQGELRVLVEKDWNCLTSRPGEEDVDTFPNPNRTC